MLFKIAAHQTKFSWLEQRSVIKFLQAEKSKPYEIYCKMCDVYGKACFGQNNVYKLKMKWKHTDFPVKKKVQGI